MNAYLQYLEFRKKSFFFKSKEEVFVAKCIWCMNFKKNEIVFSDELENVKMNVHFSCAYRRMGTTGGSRCFCLCE